MLLVIFPMFTFPKKLPPRHKKKKKRRKKLSLDDMSSDDDVLKEKSNNGKSQTVTSSMSFGKDIKGSGDAHDGRAGGRGLMMSLMTSAVN